MPKKDKSPDKKKVIYVTITIQKPKKKDIAEQREKVDKNGIVEVRTHIKKESYTSEEIVLDTWKTTEYRIPLKLLGLKADAKRSEILDKLNNPHRVVNKKVAEILKKIIKSYGGVKGISKGKYNFETERFKKKKEFKPKKKVIIG
ncbi:MAG: hypothetical protein ACTSWN_14350 [Promethearchaeota archaeon]